MIGHSISNAFCTISITTGHPVYNGENCGLASPFSTGHWPVWVASVTWTIFKPGVQSGMGKVTEGAATLTPPLRLVNTFDPRKIYRLGRMMG